MRVDGCRERKQKSYEGSGEGGFGVGGGRKLQENPGTKKQKSCGESLRIGVDGCRKKKATGGF